RGRQDASGRRRGVRRSGRGRRSDHAGPRRGRPDDRGLPAAQYPDRGAEPDRLSQAGSTAAAAPPACCPAYLRRLCWNMRSVRSHTCRHSAAAAAASSALASAALTRDSRLETWLRRLLKSSIDGASHALSANSAPTTLRAVAKVLVRMDRFPLLKVWSLPETSFVVGGATLPREVCLAENHVMKRAWREVPCARGRPGMFGDCGRRAAHRQRHG